MSAGTALRALDARLVPRGAAALRALVDGAAQRRAALADAVGRRRPGRRSALLLTALVIGGGAGAGLALGAGQPPDGAAAPAGVLLGPPPGADVDQHLEAAGQQLGELRPGARHLALVSLREGLPPAVTGELLRSADLELVRGYLRAQVPGTPEQLLFQTPGDPATGLQQLYAATAERKAQEARDLLVAAARLPAAGQADAAARDQLERQAATVVAEADAYRSGCACVFGLLVDGRAADLAALRTRPEVRGVEAAAAGARPADLDVRPPLPAGAGPDDGPRP